MLILVYCSSPLLQDNGVEKPRVGNEKPNIKLWKKKS